MSGRFVLKSSGKGKYIFTLKASNGLNVLTSESYTSKTAALHGIESVHKNASRKSNFELRVAKNGKPYFVLLAPNKEVIGQSQMYTTVVSAKKGIASVKTNAVVNKIEDLTRIK